eukprot:4235562-Pleurochrysis_carterae.AAC.1
MRIQLKSTKAEQKRKEEVAAELKTRRDRENRAASSKAYRTDKELSKVSKELADMKKKLKTSNLALSESGKRARGLAQKFITRDRQQSGKQATKTTAEQELAQVFKMYAKLKTLHAEMKSKKEAELLKQAAEEEAVCTAPESEGEEQDKSELGKGSEKEGSSASEAYGESAAPLPTPHSIKT